MTKVLLKDVRCTYIFLKEPRDGKYGLQIIQPKNHPQVPLLKKMMKAVLIDEVGEKMASKKGKFRNPLRNGDEERDEEHYENAYFMNVSNKDKPGVVDQYGATIPDSKIQEICFWGAMYHVSIDVYYFKGGVSEDGKPYPGGIGAGLNNVMFRSEADKLGGRVIVPAENEFANYADASDKDDGIDDFDDDDDDISF